jgi:hypothetical protein
LYDDDDDDDDDDNDDDVASYCLHLSIKPSLFEGKKPKVLYRDWTLNKKLKFQFSMENLVFMPCHERYCSKLYICVGERERESKNDHALCVLKFKHVKWEKS